MVFFYNYYYLCVCVGGGNFTYRLAGHLDRVIKVLRHFKDKVDLCRRICPRGVCLKRGLALSFRRCASSTFSSTASTSVGSIATTSGTTTASSKGASVNNDKHGDNNSCFYREVEAEAFEQLCIKSDGD